MKKIVLILSSVMMSVLAISVHAYDGQKCSEPGVCWEPKPGYPDKVLGSKYDPKHDPAELNKQSESIKEMEARNAKRHGHFVKTGKFEYDVEEIK